jgi:hypothetical protein
VCLVGQLSGYADTAERELVETTHVARSAATPTVAALALSIAVQTSRRLGRATQERLIERFALVVEDWLIDGLEGATREVLGVGLDEVDYTTTTAVAVSPTRPSLGSLTVRAAVSWASPADAGFDAFDYLTAWLCDLLGSDDEPERWPRDILVRDLAELRPLRFTITRAYGGKALPVLGGRIHLP